MGRGTAAAGGGGGAATLRHWPPLSPAGCHLPIASRWGGTLRLQSVVCSHSILQSLTRHNKTPAEIRGRSGFGNVGAISPWRRLRSPGRPAPCRPRSEEHTSEL